jgi:3-oxoacyl-(acyl-carrier-protein) synthase
VIVVTGIGAVAAGATGTAAFATLLSKEAPASRTIAELPALPISAREARRLSRPAAFALAAASEALGSREGAIAREDGVALGTGFGSVELTRQALEALSERADLLSPATFVASVRHEAQTTVARALKLQGPAVAASARRLSFEDALGWALVQLSLGRAKRIVALGADELTPLLERLLARYRLVRERIVLGEGAGAIVLEREEDVRGRVLARVRAWTSGVGSPAEEAAAVERALQKDGVDPGSIELFLDECDGSSRRRREREALLAALTKVKPARVRAVADHAGHFMAGGSLVAVAGVLAVSGAWPGVRARAALVSAREADGSFAAYVLEGVA